MTIGIFLFGTFAGGMASGLTGFAMGLVLSGIWLHIIPPVQTTTLIVGCGLITQSYGIWKLRRSPNWRNVAPFVLAGAIGVPVGAMLLTYIDPAHLRTAIGVFLVLYSAYSLLRPAFPPVDGCLPADLGIGFLNGILGGLTGLTGILVTIWCQLRNWPKDAQRAIFQPVNLANIVVSAMSLSVAGTVTVETAKLYLIALPLLLAGLWCGFKVYGKLDDASFRKMILALLLLSGLTLIVPQWTFL